MQSRTALIVPVTAGLLPSSASAACRPLIGSKGTLWPHAPEPLAAQAHFRAKGPRKTEEQEMRQHMELLKSLPKDTKVDAAMLRAATDMQMVHRALAPAPARTADAS